MQFRHSIEVLQRYTERVIFKITIRTDDKDIFIFQILVHAVPELILIFGQQASIFNFKNQQKTRVQ